MGEPKGVDFRTPPLPPWIDTRKGSVVLALHVQPGAGRTAVVGPHGTRLKIAVASPPADGKANAALLAFLADRLDLPRASVSLVSGASAREKRVELATERSAGAIAAVLVGPAQ